MKEFRKKYLRFLTFIIFPLFLLGCSSGKEDITKVTEEIKLNSGSALKSENGSYKLYNYEDGKYIPAQQNSMIVAYDKASSSYIYMEDEKHYIVHNGYKMEVKDKNHSDIKISPKGNYVSYFMEDEGLKLKIVTTKDNNEVKLNSNVSISGTLYDWYDEKNLVYYGINDDGVNGIFTYNLDTNKEELLYKLEGGYLSFIKASKNDLIFIQINLENQKELMIINKQSKETKKLSNQIEDLSDLIVYNDTIYFTGKVYGDTNSLYKINSDKVKRIIFDFPSMVKMEKGLSLDENGNILFVGAKGVSEDEAIYSFSEDGTIAVRSKTAKEYVFLQYRT
ncbi:hypothetical protein [Clostridium uliginosum]|uniref:DUF5050 domain-containing protein n=1 Tax=Clostridium uliginosum TaxID=119641 RepID=A0A1I1NGB0_9CLOT|nr:hypothetical protein [Clostridium uliginosum]SFC96302.1 hypothetical protein SAMN05421842_11527 [Clostridium uliginosum]